MEAVGRAAVGAAGMGGLARDLAVRDRVDLAVVTAASVAAMEAGAEAMGRAVAAVAGGGTRSGRAGRASVSSSS
jgi:hypothetical protein